MREFFRELVVAKRRFEREHEKLVAQAWHNCHIYFTTKAKKKLPALKEFLPKPVRRQSVAELKYMVQSLSEAYGIPLRKRAKAARG